MGWELTRTKLAISSVSEVYKGRDIPATSFAISLSCRKTPRSHEKPQMVLSAYD